MHTKTHINVFDFDETLFRVPSYTCREAIGRSPYDWFDDPGSLDESLNIKGIQNTIAIAKDTSQTNFLITHRVPACKQAVTWLLEKYKTHFEEVFFMGRVGRKAEVVSSILKSRPEIEKVSIYEDSLWQIIEYVEFFWDNNLHNEVEFEFFFVDKSKIIKIDFQAAIMLIGSDAKRLTIIA